MTLTPLRRIARHAHRVAGAALLSAALLLAYHAASPLWAQTGKIVDLSGLADVIDALANAIGGIPDLVRESSATMDELEAKEVGELMRTRLIHLSARLQDILVSNRADIIDPIGDYLDRQSPEKWDKVRQAMALILESVKGIEEDLKGERSDLVLDPVYRELRQLMKRRAMMLEDWMTLPPPVTTEELALLRDTHQRYLDLVDRLDVAIEDLNAFVKSLSK